MKKMGIIISCLVLTALISSCATIPEDRYNTHKGALIGAGTGALVGQIIGRSTEGTLIGLGAGTLLGALVGNSIDQDYDAARDAALYDQRVVYRDTKGSVVETVTEGVDQETNCRKVTKRSWKDGNLVSETIEEICEGEKRSKDY